MTESGRAAPAAAAWLALQQRLAAVAAHDVKNVLNGLAVNLEVVRSRAMRGAAGDQLAPFATAASDQLEAVVTLVEALLSLARPARASADVGGALGVLRGLAPLFAAAGHALIVEGDGATPAPTTVDGDTLRTLLAGALLAVADGERGADDATELRCTVEADRSGGTRVHIAGARPGSLPADLCRLADGTGVVMTPVPRGIELTIPALETD